MSKDYYIIPIFVPHRGCPHNCVFCNQKKITGQEQEMNSDIADNIIKEHLETIPKSCKELQVAFYGGSFTGIEIEIQKQLLQTAFKYKKRGIVNKIRLSTRPDYINDEILTMLKQNGVDIIELGVQSLDEKVLKLSCRGHSANDVYLASKLIKEYGFKLGLQMMIGLPGDNCEKSIYTAKKIIKLDPYCVRIYPTLVVKNTYLEKMYLQGKYLPLKLEEGVDLSAKLLMLFEYNNINVIRIGLQPTKNITLGKDVIAGPFHPAFRQLVESKINKIILDKYFNDKKLNTNEILIKSNPKDISNLVGQNSVNLKYIKQKYNIVKIKIKGDSISKEFLFIQGKDFCDKISKIDLIEKYLVEINLLPKVSF